MKKYPTQYTPGFWTRWPTLLECTKSSLYSAPFGVRAERSKESFVKAGPARRAAFVAEYAVLTA